MFLKGKRRHVIITIMNEMRPCNFTDSKTFIIIDPIILLFFDQYRSRHQTKPFYLPSSKHLIGFNLLKCLDSKWSTTIFQYSLLYQPFLWGALYYIVVGRHINQECTVNILLKNSRGNGPINKTKVKNISSK